ncbi:hypothetical protein CUMW_100660 [Citrus unshiu]|nr:hypothetical protein CUMW_100660 [Citrus unshiu]
MSSHMRLHWLSIFLLSVKLLSHFPFHELVAWASAVLFVVWTMRMVRP